MSVNKFFNTNNNFVKDYKIENNDISDSKQILAELISLSQIGNQKINFTEKIKKYATYLYILCGKLGYKELSSVFKLPSISTVGRYLNSYQDGIYEGKMRLRELKNFLTHNGFQPCVWLSEDATRIVGRIVYDGVANQIVGCLLPFDNNGMPMAFSYKFENVLETFEFLQNMKVTSLVNVIMAQPMDTAAPSFCLLMYGTDNKQNYAVTSKRWNFMKNELEKEGIKALGMSTDGDTKSVRSMLDFSDLELS